MKLLLATRSRGKQAEFRELLAPWPVQVVTPDELGLPETPDEAGLETFDTFEANARAKATWFAVLSGLPVLADDSGLEVDALRGAPGVHSRRFAGVDGTEREVTAANNALLLQQLHGVPHDRRTARYRCALVLVSSPDDGAPEIVTTGSTEGWILDAPHGAAGFGYDPLFLSRDLALSFGEASSEAKHAVSHRGRAAAALLQAIGAVPPPRD